MIIKYSDALGSSSKAFKQKGVFDGFVGIDTHLYIDPHLLSKSKAPELITGSRIFRKYFIDTIKIFKKITAPSGAIWRQAIERLVFPEMSQLGLGYSNSDRGSAIGPELASAISNTALEIIKAGIEEPEIFELIGLFEKNIGADRISDMTAVIIRESLYKYSQRIVKELKLESKVYKQQGRLYQLPYNKQTSKFVILVPEDILRNLPVALSWDDIDIVCQHNKLLRNQVNKTIGKTWRNATKKISKSILKETLIRQPEVLKDLIDQYKNKPAISYDYELDPLGEINWDRNSKEFADKYPLDLSGFKRIDSSRIFPLVQALCMQFKQLVEHNGLYELFYNESGKIKKERAPQYLFYGLSDYYCKMNNIEISREANAGSGPVDFKFSIGYSARVNVEMKYSKNPSLVDGYSEQLAAYNLAEKTEYSIYLIIKTGNHIKSLRTIDKMYKDKIANGERAPEIIIVDGRKKLSASKLKRRVRYGFSIGS